MTGTWISAPPRPERINAMSKMKRSQKTRRIRVLDLESRRSPKGGKKATRKKAARTYSGVDAAAGYAIW